MSNSTSWVFIGHAIDVPRRGARRIITSEGPVAVFRTQNDRYFALADRCPHKNGPLSQGIVHDASVTCPLHNLVVDLETGRTSDADLPCARTIPVDLRGGELWIAAHLGLDVSPMQAAE
jgi:nitrite reductase (NADH) small subunit